MGVGLLWELVRVPAIPEPLVVFFRGEKQEVARKECLPLRDL